MADLNKVMLIGNLTRDPEVRYTPKGTAIGDIAIALNNSYKGQDGQVKEEVCYVDIVVWDRQAETCKQYLTKGSPIFVEGRLQLDQWQDKDGNKKSRLRVRADRVQFLGRPKEGSSSGSGSRGGSGGGEYNQAPAPARSQAPAYNDAHESAPSDDDVPF